MLTLFAITVGLGVFAGMRTTVAPTAVSWAAYLGWLNLGDTWLAFLGSVYAPWILSLCLAGELIGDKLPFTPSRKLPGPFAARLVSGGICGLALGYAGAARRWSALLAASSAPSSARWVVMPSGRGWRRRSSAIFLPP